MTQTNTRKVFFELVNSAPVVVWTRLDNSKLLRERPDFHPEPNTFEHIRIVTERLMATDDPDLIMAGMLHDICKIDTVRINPKTGFPTCPGHDHEAAKLVSTNKDVQEWIVNRGANVEMVAQLCNQHMRFHQFGQMKPSKQQAFTEMACWDKLQFLGAADNMLSEFDKDDLDKSFKWNRK